MKLREVTEATKAKYLNQVDAITKDYDDMISKINGKFAKYGLIQYQMSQGILDTNYAKKQKEALKTEIKNINVTTLDQIVEKLKAIKEAYIKEVAPATAITDPLELSFIEKELKVMTDKELLDYYKENYMDTNIVRLIEIEHKARHGYKDGKVVMPLPEYGVEDGVTKQLDAEIKTAIAMRSVVSTMCVFVGAIDETGTKVPKMISWGTVFEQVEQRNKSSFKKVSLLDFINGMPAKNY